MPIVPVFNDEVRLKVLNALLKKGAIKSSVPEIIKATGLDLVSVKKALRWLEEEIGVESYYPRIPSDKVGFNIKAMVFLQIDRTRKEGMEDLLKFFEQETTVISVHKIIGSGKWNFAFRVIAKNLEEFDNMINEKLLLEVKDSKELILDKHYVFFGEPKFEPKVNKRALALISTMIDKNIRRVNYEKVLPSEEYKLKVFDCISSGVCLKANVRFIKKETGLHMSTIKASLKFLLENGFIESFVPTVNFAKVGDRFFVFDFVKIDYKNIEKLEVLKKIIETDPNVFQARYYFGDQNHNFVFMQTYDSIENYEKEFPKKYLLNEELEGFVQKGGTYFTLTHPFERKGLWPSKSSALIKTLIRDSGKQI